MDLNDLVDYFQQSKSADAGEQSNVKKTVLDEPKAFDLIIAESFPDSAARSKFKNFLTTSGIYKDINTTDIGPVRLVSLYDTIVKTFNPETKFYNVLNSKPVEQVTDYQARIVEEDINNYNVTDFNMDGALPAVNQSVLSQRSNTLQAKGQGLAISWMEQELAAQGPYKRQEYATQLMFAAIRMAKSWSATMLSNTEQTSESVPNVPSLGGFITRSVQNVIPAGGGNLTDALIAQMIGQLAVPYGYDAVASDIVAFTNAAQIPVIRNLMINRYPGTDPMSKLQYDNVLKARMGAVGLPDIQAVYEDNNGVVIPFVRDLQLPANTTLFFRASFPRMGGFKFGGKFGPYVVSRQIGTFYDLNYMFDLKTLLDPMVNTRGTITNHL